MMSVRPLVLASALALVASPCLARPDEDVPGLVKIINDEGKPLPERLDALERAATYMSRQPLPHAGPLKDALGPLLDRAVHKRKDAALASWAVHLLLVTEVFKPFDGLAPRLKPLLASDTPPALRQAALRTIQVHAVEGLAPELEAYLREGGDQPDRQLVERKIIDAANKLTPADSVRINAVALEVSKHRNVRLPAARTLGETRSEVGRRALLKAAAIDERDELVACEAALSLGRHGSLEGAGLLVERLRAKQGTIAVYRAVCKLSLHEEEGFGGVLPNAYNEAGREGRAKAMAAAAAWWETARPRSREDLLFDALKAKGVNVPNDRRGKESITALIDALSVDPSSLRYAALDLLVERTGKTDLAERFKSVQRSMGGSAAVVDYEPPEGFGDELRRELLKQQQAEKQARWRSWWTSVKDRAENVNGKWMVRG